VEIEYWHISFAWLFATTAQALRQKRCERGRTTA
jgi:hypothetical protein